MRRDTAAWLKRPHSHCILCFPALMCPSLPPYQSLPILPLPLLAPCLHLSFVPAPACPSPFHAPPYPPNPYPQPRHPVRPRPPSAFLSPTPALLLSLCPARPVPAPFLVRAPAPSLRHTYPSSPCIQTMPRPYPCPCPCTVPFLSPCSSVPLFPSHVPPYSPSPCLEPRHPVCPRPPSAPPPPLPAAPGSDPHPEDQSTRPDVCAVLRWLLPHHADDIHRQVTFGPGRSSRRLAVGMGVSVSVSVCCSAGHLIQRRLHNR